MEIVAKEFSPKSRAITEFGLRRRVEEDGVTYLNFIIEFVQQPTKSRHQMSGPNRIGKVCPLPQRYINIHDAVEAA
jgi:hypothetical protein